MSEQEFENYLLLLSKFLGLSKRQQESIASELRDHMEHRLDDLQSQGVSREEAIRTALEEFGDASNLAHELSNVARDRKRRWMMRLTTGSLAAAVLTVVATMAFWPNDSRNSAFAPANAHADETADAAGNAPGEPADTRSHAISFSNESLDEAAAAIRKNLERKCDVEFFDSSLSEVVEFTREVLEKPVILDTAALDELAIGPGAIVPDTKLAQVSLKSGLHRVLGELGLTTMIENESLMITTPDRSAGKLTTRFYPVWDLVKPLAKKSSNGTSEVHSAFRPSRSAADFDTLIDIVIANIAPDTWDDVGGEGSIQAYKGMLVVSNTDDVHKRMEQLVRQLRRFPIYSDVLNSGDALSIAVGDAAATIEKKLRQKQSIQFYESALDDAIVALKGKNQLNIEIDSNALDELAIDRGTSVSVDVQDVSLKSTLNLMLKPIGLTYMVEDGYIHVTTPEKAAGKLYTRCHDVRGVVDFPAEFDAEQMRTESETLLDIVTATIAPDTWDEVGGEGSLSAFPRKGVIICSNTLEVHNELDAFLNVSRTVRATSKHSAPRDANIVGQDKSITRYYVFKAPDVNANEIAEAVRELIAPDSWIDGAFAKVVQNRLIVRNSRQVHKQVAGLLADLRLEIEFGRGTSGGMF